MLQIGIMRSVQYIFHEPVEDRGDLCSGRVALRHELAGSTVDQALRDSPAERLAGIGGNTVRVGEAVQLCARIGVQLPVLRIAVQDRGKLLARDLGIGREGGAVRAGDDAVGGRQMTAFS